MEAIACILGTIPSASGIDCAAAAIAVDKQLMTAQRHAWFIASDEDLAAGLGTSRGDTAEPLIRPGHLARMGGRRIEYREGDSASRPVPACADAGLPTGLIATRGTRMTILDEIVASKRREVAAARRRMPLEELEAQAAEAPPVRDFRAALAGPGPIQLIAEVKKASPSAQVIRADFDPVAIARTYQEHGAACISVLTDVPYFQGHLSYLARVRASVAIPLLRKDFLIDEYQVVEARLAGADAILLIAEILDDDDAGGAPGAGAGAGDGGPRRVPRPGQPAPRPRRRGRPGRDQQPRPAPVRHRPRAHPPAPRPGPARRSCWSARAASAPGSDVERLEAAGVSAILVGESLMRPPDIGLAVERLLGLAPEAAASDPTASDSRRRCSAACPSDCSRCTRMKWSVNGEWGWRP